MTDPILSAEERERRARAMEEARKNAERRALVKILLDMLKEIQEYVKASKTTDSPIDALIKLLAIADLPGVSNKTRQRAQALSKLTQTSSPSLLVFQIFSNCSQTTGPRCRSAKKRPSPMQASTLKG